jgi:hypothetical protein
MKDKEQRALSRRQERELLLKDKESYEDKGYQRYQQQQSSIAPQARNSRATARYHDERQRYYNF